MGGQGRDRRRASRSRHPPGASCRWSFKSVTASPTRPASGRSSADRTRRTPGRTPAFAFGGSASPMSPRFGSGARTSASVVRSTLFDLSAHRKRPDDPNELIFDGACRTVARLFSHAVQKAQTGLRAAGKDASRLEGYTWHSNRHSVATGASRLEDPQHGASVFASRAKPSPGCGGALVSADAVELARN